MIVMRAFFIIDYMPMYGGVVNNKMVLLSKLSQNVKNIIQLHFETM